MSAAALSLGALGCLLASAGDSLPAPAQVEWIAFSAVADSLNTLDEDGVPMSWVGGIRVSGLATNRPLVVAFPQVPGVDRRELSCRRWNPASRRWEEVTGLRVRRCDAREGGAIEAEVAQRDGLYGVFATRDDAGSHVLAFRGLEPGATEPAWRLVQAHARVVVEGVGARVLALNELPPDTQLAVEWKTLSGPQRAAATLWQWCELRNRRLHRGPLHLEIPLNSLSTETPIHHD